MAFDDYKLDKFNNAFLDLDVYLRLNKDITDHGINTPYKIIKYLFEYVLLNGKILEAI
jgi:hypothetical protein